MINQLYFTFNNTNSLDLKDLLVSELPTPSSPDTRVNKIKIVGRSGALRVAEKDEYGGDVLDSIDKDVKMTYFGNDYDLLKRWLRGTSKLTLSNQTDRYFRASVDNKIPLEKIIRQIHNFTVTFSCFPYAYLKIGDIPIIYTPTETTWETIIMNEYELSLPHIKIYGQGDIGVMINGVETDFYSVDDYIDCDSELQQCYKETQNQGTNMRGLFPALYPGKNVIEFTGNIKKVILTPKWRAR